MRANNVAVEYALELIEHNIDPKKISCAVCRGTFKELMEIWSEETKKRFD